MLGLFVGIGYHGCHEVVGIYDSAFAALHLAVGEFDHAVGEVDETLTPLEAEFVEQDGEHLEMVVLLIAHHIDHLVDGEVLETELGGADVLCHIDGGAIGTKKEFFVESFCREVSPHGAIFATIEEAFLQPFHHLFLAFEVGVRLVVYLVETYAHHLVGLIKSSIDPLIHLLPETAYFRVALLPLDEHLMGFLDEGSLLFGLLFVHAQCNQFLDFFAVMLVEGYIVVAYEVVTLLARGFRCLTVAPFEPCQHALTDVDTAVVHDVGLDHLVTVGFDDACEGAAKKVVPDMTEVEGLVGVGGRVFYHHQRTLVGDRLETELRVGIDLIEQGNPRGIANDEVEEALHHIELGDHIASMFHKVLSNLVTHHIGSLTGCFHEGEHYHSEVSFKLLTSLLQLHLLGSCLHAIQRLHSFLYACYEFFFYCHILLFTLD